MAISAFFKRAVSNGINFYKYCTVGVWREPRNTLFVRIVKTVNLSVRSFLDRSLQMKSAALTYSSVLALVPVDEEKLHDLESDGANRTRHGSISELHLRVRDKEIRESEGKPCQYQR